MIRNKSIKAKAIRTNCVTNMSTEVDIVVEIRRNDSLGADFLHIIVGAVTGYESCQVDAGRNGWLACMGTPFKWDKLEVSAAEMNRIYHILGVTTEFPLKTTIRGKVCARGYIIYTVCAGQETEIYRAICSNKLAAPCPIKSLQGWCDQTGEEIAEYMKLEYTGSNMFSNQAVLGNENI